METFQQQRNGAEVVKQDESCSCIAIRQVRRLALLSPWSGGNLGNTAILSSLILNVSKRNPDVDFVGITLSAKQASRRFGIENFALAAEDDRPYYAQSSAGNSNADEQQPPKAGGVKQWLKQLPLIGPLLTVTHAWSRQITDTGLRLARFCLREIAHVAAATRVIRGLDAVIVSGGGALDVFWGGPWGHPWNLLKWSVLSRIYRIPFLVVSVGKGSLEHTASRFFVRIALKLATYRSYRELDTKMAIQALIDVSKDPVVPDLAFSYPVSVVHTSQDDNPRNGRLLVGVSPMVYCHPQAWPLHDERRYTAYLFQLTEISKWLLKNGHKMLLFATDDPDLESIKDLLTSLAGTPRDSDAIQTLPGPFDQSINGHLEGIAQADLIIASRLHGVLLSHLIALPVLALSYDPKVDSHMRSVRQADYCLHVDTLDIDTFIDRFEALKDARLRESTHLRSVALTFRQQLDLQYDSILGLAKSNYTTGDHKHQEAALPQVL